METTDKHPVNKYALTSHNAHPV